jgi:uncharacterized protein involved in response to NO
MAFLSAGFRPFFLLTALHGLTAMTFWLVWLGIHLLNGMIGELSIGMPPHLWHGHEMLFGFLTAAAGGFLLTAVPNWTGTAPISGRPLAVLVLAWLAGRVAIWASAVLPTAVVITADALFLPLLAALLAGPLLAAGKARNAAFLPLLALLWAGQMLSHAGIEGWLDDSGAAGRLLAVDVAALLMVVIGGRITPTFSRNWLRLRGGDLPMTPPLLDKAAVLATVAVLASDLLAPWLGDGPRAVLALAAGLCLALRAVTWRGWRVREESLLWVLHLGALWLAVGFLLRGGSLLWDWLPETTALHAHTVGAAGTLILGVMTRASYGHSGRPLSAGPALTVAFALVTAAALLRLLPTVLWPDAYLESVTLAGGLWCGAMVIFLVNLTPVLLSRRIPSAAR